MSQNEDDESDGETQRLPREEVRRRMLSALDARVADQGLSVGLDHIPLEAIIEDAGVSRSAVHRIWGPKEKFYADAIIHLIDPEGAPGAAYDQATIDLIEQLIEDNRELLLTTSGRVRLFREAARCGVQQNYGAIRQSIYWRSYIALATGTAGVPDEDRERVLDAVRKVELAFIDRMAGFYKLMLAYFQRKPIEGVTPEQIASAGAAVVEGLVIKSALTPEIVEERLTLPALEDEAEWHLASIAFLGIMEALTVPLSEDPAERSF